MTWHLSTALGTRASTSTYRTLILVLAYCGLRWSEAIGMHVRDINFERDRIQVNRAAVEVEGRIVVGAPKNWERRIVPFPEFLETPLRDSATARDRTTSSSPTPTAITSGARRPASARRHGSAPPSSSPVSNA